MMQTNERKALFDENYKRVSEKINEAATRSGRKPEDITLLMATKTVPPEIINYAFSKGIKVMGENRVQEFLSKEEFLHKELRRQFIGTLQTNKVKQIVGKVELIQSVDSLKLAKEISKHSVKLGIVSDILIEINIAAEASKGGISAENLSDFVDEIKELDAIRIRGLMTLGPVTDDKSVKSEYFYKMNKLFIDNSTKNVDNVNMDILSMGMSDDYDLAIEHGSTMVRVGSALFGQRY